MSTFLITGANRGIGYELAVQFSEDSKNTVIATSRSLKNAEQLTALKRKNVHVIQLDVNDSLETIKKSLTELDKVAPKGVDVVINSAGISLPHENGIDLTTIAIDDYTTHFNTNTLGSIKVYQAVYPYWTKKTGNVKKFIFVSSGLGWINNYFGMTAYGYGLSKAAVNFFTKEVSTFHTQSLDEDIKNSITVAIHPGVVATDMFKNFVAVSGSAPTGLEILSPAECGEKLKKLFDELTTADNGTFKSYDGTTVLW